MLINHVELVEKGDMVVLSAQRNAGLFEPETFQFLTSLEPKGSFIDIGAYTGIYGIWASKQGYRAFCFEPHTDNYTRLIENVKKNNEPVTCYNIALSDKAGVSSLNVNSNVGLTSGGSLSTGIRNHNEALKVKKEVYDRFARGDESVIKIDVEGHELNVLKGMSTVLEFERPVLIVEVLDRQHENEIVFYLNQFDYSLHSILDERNAIFICNR